MDLTRDYPRSALERFAGVVMAPRTTDKCRAHLQGTLGEYIYNCGLDRKLFAFLGTNVGNLFNDSRIALLPQGQQLGYGRTLDANKPAFPWGIVALPKGPAGRFAINIGAACSLTRGGKQSDAGWELLTLIGSLEFSRRYMGDGLAAIAPRKSVMADVLQSPNLPFGCKDVVDYGESLRRLPTIARWVEVSSTISRHFGRLWNGDAPLTPAGVTAP